MIHHKKHKKTKSTKEEGILETKFRRQNKTLPYSF
jgi:hypothetical protein